MNFVCFKKIFKDFGEIKKSGKIFISTNQFDYYYFLSKKTLGF